MSDKKETEIDINSKELDEEVLGAISGGWGGTISPCRIYIGPPQDLPDIYPCSDMSPCQDAIIDSCMDTNIDSCVDVPITTCVDLNNVPTLDPDITPCGLDVNFDTCAMDANCTGYADIGICNSDALGVCGMDASITACLTDSGVCTGDWNVDVCRGDASDLYGDLIDPNICIADTSAFGGEGCVLDSPFCAGYGGAGICPDNPSVDMPETETCAVDSPTDPLTPICLLDISPDDSNEEIRCVDMPCAKGW
ncbi:MAG: hypothetical protein ACYDEX_02825 [Mobilitalea sp.]